MSSERFSQRPRDGSLARVSVAMFGRGMRKNCREIGVSVVIIEALADFSVVNLYICIYEGEIFSQCLLRFFLFIVLSFSFICSLEHFCLSRFSFERVRLLSPIYLYLQSARLFIFCWLSFVLYIFFNFAGVVISTLLFIGNVSLVWGKF